jgi:polar amino acid transport system substrate-binding protein
MKRLVSWLLSAVALAVAYAGCCASSSALAEGSVHPGCEPAKVAEKFPAIAGKTLRVSIAPDTPPGRYRDPNNPDKILGYDPDLIEAVMGCLGVKYELITTEFSGLIQGIQAGQTDLIWSNLFYNHERAKVVDFVLYQRTGDAVLVRKGNPKKISGMQDLCGLHAAA